MKRTNAYIVTLDRNNFDHAELFHELRLITFLFNKTENTSFRVMRRGRLGRNNAAASLYRGRYQYHVKTDHAARFDIYLYDRNNEYMSEKRVKLNSMLKDWAFKTLAYN